MELKNYYSILGIHQGASESEIKRAYRVLAKKFHPDRNNARNAKENFIEITEAYKVLVNSITRKDYDALFNQYLRKERTHSEQYSARNRDSKSEEAFREKKKTQTESNFENVVKQARFSSEMDYNQLLEKGLVELFYGFFKIRFVFLAILMLLAIIVLYLSW
jgi:DnaJ-class molecular chaperone